MIGMVSRLHRSSFGRLSATLTLVAGCLIPEATAESRLLRENVIEQIEARIAAEMTQQQIPGLSVAVAVDNELRYSNGFGQSDLEHGVPARAVTVYRTASIAKPMTAAIVMRLAEDGKLQLDESVRKYCPDFPEKRWTVTPRQLLGHLGGVRHYKARGEAAGKRHFPTLKSALPLFADDSLLHEPGTKFQYTTYGYNLLGMAAEGAAEKEFPALLKQLVLEPAGMQHTQVDNVYDVIPNRARGYVRFNALMILSNPNGPRVRPGKLYNAELHDTSMKIPGGGLVSSAPDLVRFALAMNEGQLLNADSLEASWTRQTTSDEKRTGYGLGWSVMESNGMKVVSHGGAQAGTATHLRLIPEHGVAVAAMCNMQGSNLSNLTDAIAAIVLPEKKPTGDELSWVDDVRRTIQREVEQKELPAFSIALVDGDRIVWSEGFGRADPEQNTPATADTVYRVGSLSKLFSDIAVMQLVEQGKLKLDDDIRTVLPGFQPKNSFKTPITLRQLMSHQSGLVRESPVGHYFDPTEPSLAETVRSLNGTSLVYPPDTRTKYSNAAVSVAGYVLEKSTGTSFAEYMRRQILNPLGMAGSDYEATKKVKGDLARAWMWTLDGRRFEAPTFALGTPPAGNLYSSVNDLGRFLTVLFNDGRMSDGQLLKPETLQQMMSRQKTKDGREMRFGIGFAVSEFDGHKSVGHGGAVYGFSTQIRALPEKNVGVVAVASLDGANGIVGRLSDHVLRVMLARKEGQDAPKFQSTQPVPEEICRRTAGRFKNGEMTVEFTELGGKLHLMQGSYRKEVRSRADGFIIDDAMSFGPEIQIKSVDEVVVGSVKYERVAEAHPAPVPQHWKGLIGEYGWDHNTLYILEDQGKLYALIEWFYFYPLKELSKDEYAFPDYGLYHGEKLIFHRGASGKATKVVAAEVLFERRAGGPEDGETFKITPVKPVAELRDAALAAQPPKEADDFRKSELVDVATLDPTVKLDIRYATTNNFTGAVFYRQPRAFMQRPAAEAVLKVHRRLKGQGFGLLIHDAYRPWHVTKMFWDATPDKFKDFVANPQRGSRHNRGCAVDLTLYHLKTGKPVQMVAGYDEFSTRSFPAYPGGTSLQRWHRELLRKEMQAAGFSVYEYEWWHFDFKDWKRYGIQNLTFEQIDESNGK